MIVFLKIFFRDWMSEVERIFVRNTKRKVSGGDFAGSSSPLITESAPNSPASTHYGLASMPFVLIMKMLRLFSCHKFLCWDLVIKFICINNAHKEAQVENSMYFVGQKSLANCLSLGMILNMNDHTDHGKNPSWSCGMKLLHTSLHPYFYGQLLMIRLQDIIQWCTGKGIKNVFSFILFELLSKCIVSSYLCYHLCFLVCWLQRLYSTLC